MDELMQTIDPEHDERARVEGWRLHVLIEAGYPIRFAEQIAGSEADLHAAVALIDSGCTPEIATRILL